MLVHVLESCRNRSHQTKKLKAILSIDFLVLSTSESSCYPNHFDFTSESTMWNEVEKKVAAYYSDHKVSEPMSDMGKTRRYVKKLISVEPCEKRQRDNSTEQPVLVARDKVWPITPQTFFFLPCSRLVFPKWTSPAPCELMTENPCSEPA